MLGHRLEGEGSIQIAKMIRIVNMTSSVSRLRSAYLGVVVPKRPPFGRRRGETL
jgi:hypothetical protein